MELATSVLSFWFGEWPYNEPIAKAQASKWFESSPEIDSLIKDQFESQIRQLLEASHEEVIRQSDPQKDIDSCIANILLLDQFTRNIYRGTAKAFSGDDKALSICLKVIEDEPTFHSLPLAVAAFVCMPLQHSEAKEIQGLSIKTYRSLVSIHGESAKGYADFAQIHKDIIDQFGRYPHRNDALGRSSTEEELAYLNSDGHRFGQ